MLITSVNNDRIKELVKLKDKRYRDTVNLFFIEGYDIVLEAYKNNCIKELYVLDGTLVDMDVQYTYVSYDVMKKISDMESISEYYAVCYKKEDKEVGNRVMILDGLQDPGNLGTIIRSAVAFNIDTIILSNDTVDYMSPKVLRSTMGGAFRVNVIVADDLLNMIDEIKKNGFEVAVTDLATDKSIYDVNYSKKAIVIGNEANGVRKEINDLVEMIKESEPETIVCIKDGNKIVNPTTAESYIPHYVKFFSNDNLEFVLDVLYQNELNRK